MDLSYGAEYERFRQEVRAFLRDHCSVERRRDPQRIARFRRQATERGYLFRIIPRRFGGVRMLVPTLLECGAPWRTYVGSHTVHRRRSARLAGWMSAA